MTTGLRPAARAGAPVPALPAGAGLGLKPAHFRDILDTLPDLGFFEIHAENWFVAGGPFHHFLARIRERYPLSIHGVGLSIGAEGPLDPEHLSQLERLVARYEPASVSEHLAWSTHGGIYANDLLPVPYDRTTLARVCAHVDQVQARLGRRMLLENPATYVEFEASDMEETTFIAEVVRRTGCALLLDVNNLHVSCTNHRRDATASLRALARLPVGEIHLAGFAADRDGAGDPLLIDSHGAPVAHEVWALYETALDLLGPRPTLLERDNDVPAFPVLLAEAREAGRRLAARRPMALPA